MTRINTNVSSLISQKTLSRSNADLQTSLTRLSTGLRINVGKDDPAGLIASEALRSDIISVKKAITNSERANQLIATADSALGQVSSLLNDIRGLVSEAANSGALSDEQIAANQLQVDSSLEAIDRIATVTSFQGKRLLDGSLDFLTTGVNNTEITDLQIDQANFGALSEIGIEIDVVTQATKGQLDFNFNSITEVVVLEIGGETGTEAFNFASGSTAAQIATAVNLVSDALGVSAEVLDQDAQQGSINVSSFGADNDIILTANTAGETVGDIRVKYDSATAGQALSVNYTAQSGSSEGTIEVLLETEAYVASTGQIDDTSDTNNAFQIDALVKGTEFDGVTVTATNVANTGANAVFTYDHSTKVLNVDVESGVTTAGNLVTALAAVGNEDAAALFSISAVGESDGTGTLTAANGAYAGFTSAGGVDGGSILSSGNDVITAINDVINGAGADVTATLAASNDGHEVVTDFGEFALSGIEESNSLLQYLAPSGTRDIRFVSAAGTSLSVDLSTDPEVTDFASATFQSTIANASIEITAKTAGADLNDIDIVINNLTDDTVVYDEEAKTLTLNVDLGGGFTGDNLRDIINNDSYVSQFFSASRFGSSTGAGNIAIADAGTVGTTAGGVTGDGTVIVNLATNTNGTITTTAQDLIDYFDDTANAGTLSPLGISITNAAASDGTGLLEVTATDIQFSSSEETFTDAPAAATTFAVNGEDAQLTFTAVQSGTAFDGVEIKFEDSAANGAETVSYDTITKVLTIGIEDGVSTATQVAAAVTGDVAVSALFTAVVAAGGGDAVTDTDTATLSGGSVAGGSQNGAAFLSNEDAGANGLRFTSTQFGSDAFISVKALSGTFALTDVDGNVSDRSEGTDVDARINGIQAVADGLRATLNTSSLDLSFSLSENVTANTTLNFTITGGGAQFQLGPDVVSNQQARLGIQSVNTAKLGGVSGRLFELRSGGTKDLDSNAGGAATVVEEVITQITTLRGRLGALQKTTLETNIFALNDTLVNLIAAESSIRDADFAAESANLTRAQILVQSGVSVLGIANSNPQNVLALLR